MGWLGKIISKVKNTKYADVMTGQVPIFSQFGRDIYVSDVVQQAIECIANEMSKLEPCFIRGVGNDYQTPENDVYQIQNLLDQSESDYDKIGVYRKTYLWIVLTTKRFRGAGV